MFNGMAIESIVQRGRSPFFKDLTTCIQKVQDALYDDYNETSSYIFNKINTLNFTYNIKNICNKYVGGLLNKVIIENIRSYNLSITTSMIDNNNDRVGNVAITAAVASAAIEALYDDTTGSYTGKDRNYSRLIFKLEVGLYLFVLRNADNSFYFPADEIAAAILHEIGHIDESIITGYKYNFKLQACNDIVKYISHNYDEKFISIILEKLNSSKYLTEDWKDVLAIVNKHFTTKNNNEMENAAYEAMDCLITIIASDAAGRLFYVTEQVETRLHEVDTERSADEYSSRNGTYQSLVSFLIKFENLYTYKDKIDDKYKVSDIVYKISIVNILFQLFDRFSSIFELTLCDIDCGYDPKYRRFSLIVETAKHAFHDDGLSKDASEDIKKQIEECEKYIAKHNSDPVNKIRKMLFDWKQNIIKLGRVLKSPIDNRLHRDYEKLQDATRSVSRNPFYYLAKK